MKSDIIYSNETLYVILEGTVKRKDMKDLENKINSIISEYGISDIIIDTKKLINQNDLYFDIFSEHNNVRIKKV